MSATHSTTNYNLPIFNASDSPKWLVDWNGAMNTIDSAINTVATAASGAAGDITTLQSDLQTLSGTVTTQGTSISTLTSSLSTLSGTVNTITSLIGNGEPTTTDKTIIGAINELHSDIQSIVVSVDADDVTYDNTQSGLLATNVQSAIDELASSSPSPAASTAKRYIFIGDSYNTSDTPVGGTQITPWGTLLEDMLDADDCYNSGVSGAGFVSGTTFKDQLETLGLTVPNKNTITDIVVAGGVNDIASINDVAAAIVTFSNYVANNYPNAVITLAMISWSKTLSGRPNYVKMLKIYEQAAELPNVRAITNSIDIYHNYSYWQSASEQHPNLSGSTAIAQNIANYLKGNNTGISDYNKLTLTADTTDLPITSIGDAAVHEYFGNGVGSIRIRRDGGQRNVNFQFTAHNFVSGQQYKLATFTPKWVSFNNKCVSTIAFLKDSSSHYYDVTACVTINDGDIIVEIMVADGASYTTFNNIEQLTLQSIPEFISSAYEC